MEKIIELKNIAKTYELKNLEVPVLHNINLVIEKGEMAVIVEPSGFGKSTLMNIIGLLDRPSGGDYLLEDKKILRQIGL